MGKLNILTAGVVLLAVLDTAQAESLVFPPYGHSYGIRKATPQHLFMFFGPRTFFDNPQGLATARLDAWDDPSTEKDDDEVVVYGVNCDRHQIIYNTSMWTLGLYGKKGSGEGCFLYPKGVAADRHGNVYVADSGNNRIVHLKNPKSTVEWVRSFTGATDSDKGLAGPSRVALDEDGRVYATDGAERILVFDGKGNRYRSIQCQGVPMALAVADGKAFWSFYRDERAIYFCEGGTTLVKCDFAGKVLKKAQLPGGKTATYGAIDYYHNYWITDTKNHVLLKYDHQLNLLDVFGSMGSGDNQFVEPRGITIYKRYGQVFIAEKKGAQYYWIGTHLKKAALVPKEDGRSVLTVSLTEYSFVSLYSMVNGDTTFLVKRRRMPAGTVPLEIRRKEPIAAGEAFNLKVEPTYSSYTYNSWLYPISANR